MVLSLIHPTYRLPSTSSIDLLPLLYSIHRLALLHYLLHPRSIASKIFVVDCKHPSTYKKCNTLCLIPISQSNDFFVASSISHLLQLLRIFDAAHYFMSSLIVGKVAPKMDQRRFLEIPLPTISFMSRSTS